MIALGGIAFELLSFEVSSTPDRFWDFLNAYYLAGQAVLHHDSAMLRGLIEKGVSGFVNIPAVAYLFAPFALLPPLVATMLFTVIGIGLLVATWFLLVRLAGLELRERVLLAFLFLVNGPLLDGVKYGNLAYFVLFALTAGLALLRSGRSGWAGALLGLATVIKPPLGLFGLFFLLRRDLWGLLGFALVGVAIVALSLVLFGWADNYYWFETIILQYSHGWLSVYSVQSIPAFLLRLRPEIDYTHALTHIPTSAERLSAGIFTGLIVVIGASAWIRNPRCPQPNEAQAVSRCDLQYLFFICLVLVSSPLSWDRYYSWLLVPTAFFLGARAAFPRLVRGLGWLAIALVTPLAMWPDSLGGIGHTTVYRSLAVSHLLFGGLLWFGLIAWWLAYSGGFLSPIRAAASRTRLSPDVRKEQLLRA
jgi:hypothetical protein